jgi:hypothetical protein
MDAWEKSASRGEIEVARTKKQTQFAVVHSFAAHAHYIADAALDLIEQDRILAAIPLVRSVYEFALTAQWTAQVSDAAEALINETYRQRDNTSKVMLETPVDLIRKAAATITGTGQLRLPTTSDTPGRIFRARCDDLTPGGPQAYLNYRLMSEYVHPGVIAADQYLTEAPETPLGVTLRLEPRQSVGEANAMWAFFIAAGLVWAGRAVDFFDKRHLRRSELRTLASSLGIESALQPSETATKRRSPQAQRAAREDRPRQP